jgi:hypothetical protein
VYLEGTLYSHIILPREKRKEITPTLKEWEGSSCISFLLRKEEGDYMITHYTYSFEEWERSYAYYKCVRE